MNITQFTMEEVRCFAGRQEFNIRPLTFLVGENSTGKTTALACFQVLANYFCEKEMDFNADPYSMGIFRDIVRSSRKAEKVFKLGFTFKGTDEDVECTVEFVEKPGGVEPAVKSITVKFADGVAIFTPKDIEGIELALFDEEQNQCRIDVAPRILDRNPPFFLLDPSTQMSLALEDKPEDENVFERYLTIKHENTGIAWWWIREGMTVFSTAPVRSRPRRTYDPTRVFDDPGGNYVPMLLMEIKATQKKRWETLKGQLVEFGKRSGLFQNIDVRVLGGSMGNPFQLRVKVRGPNSNIIDVGYGVSQILPILVHILDPDVGKHQMTYSLLQQPEVHLHPTAQAELSTLLATMASEGNRAFIVETHSDYMIDRARIEIRERHHPSRRCVADIFRTKRACCQGT